MVGQAMTEGPTETGKAPRILVFDEVIIITALLVLVTIRCVILLTFEDDCARPLSETRALTGPTGSTSLPV